MSIKDAFPQDIVSVENRLRQWVFLDGIKKSNAVNRVYGCNFGFCPTLDLCLAGKAWMRRIVDADNELRSKRRAAQQRKLRRNT